MTLDLRPETQAEAEALAREFLGVICSSRPGTLNPMMQPDFTTLDFEAKTLTLSYEALPWMSNPVGMMHGGAIATAADIAMGVLTYTLSGKKMPPTVTQQTSYLRPAPLGSRLIVRARADSVGKTTAALSCDMWLEGAPEKLVATGSGVYHTGGKVFDQWRFDEKEH